MRFLGMILAILMLAPLPALAAQKDDIRGVRIGMPVDDVMKVWNPSTCNWISPNSDKFDDCGDADFTLGYTSELIGPRRVLSIEGIYTSDKTFEAVVTDIEHQFSLGEPRKVDSSSSRLEWTLANGNCLRLEGLTGGFELDLREVCGTDQNGDPKKGKLELESDRANAEHDRQEQEKIDRQPTQF